MTSRKEVRRGPDEQIKSTPLKRSDGELYSRPVPNPFSRDWCEGYDDGLEGLTGILGSRDSRNYWDGHKNGILEKEELEKLGDSNA